MTDTDKFGLSKSFSRVLDVNSNNLDKFLTRLINTGIGYDPLLRDSWVVADPQGYPPYNIERLDDDNYVVTLAAAGFSEEDIDITEHNGLLTIEGKVEEKTIEGDTSTEKTYLYKGIASRSFKRQFRLAEYVEVNGATMTNGLLVVNLSRNIPEERKPKKIPLGSSK